MGAPRRGMWPSAWAIMEHPFRTFAGNVRTLSDNEDGRLTFGPRFPALCRSRRWRVPRSDSEVLNEPETSSDEDEDEASDSNSLPDEDFARLQLRDRLERPEN